MQTITTVDALREEYEDARPGAITKVQTRLTPLYRRWIGHSKFAIVSTVGPEGTDASPRGDREGVVRMIDDKTLWMPDWRGNNRLDTLTNIVVDGRVSLMFMVPGSTTVVRVNGTAVLTADTQVTHTFVQNKRSPRTVIVVAIGEVYFQCAKALMRSDFWGGDDKPADLPSAGDFLHEVQPEFDGEAYDDGYAEYAKDRMW